MIDNKLKRHIRSIRRFYKEGFTNSELAIMYNSTIVKIAAITRGLKRPERI